MLVLTRRKGQSVRITTAGGDVVVVTVSDAGTQVRLGFEADRSVIIERGEVTPRGPSESEVRRDAQ
jgi:carbon storage regulator CsrA